MHNHSSRSTTVYDLRSNTWEILTVERDIQSQISEQVSQLELNHNAVTGI